ncbi:MAG TPA: beta-ketoacyl-[acyl-carrier-protein] synthase family protein, partial [Ruminiclostridium sp.]|nr:beta-ketoacyl-[acyl-carrier-protein] synthase family protein [Ruminiclostridium sp.]
YKKQDSSLFARTPENKDVKSFFVAAFEALNQAGLDFRKFENTDRVGAFIADRDLNSINYVEKYAPLLQKCCRDDETFDYGKFYSLLSDSDLDLDAFSDFESINHFFSRSYNITGPQLSTATACASGNTSIGEGFLKIKNGYIDYAVVGGAYNYDMSAMIGFTRLGALTVNPDPETASRPFDAERNGFVMSSGCGVLVLESLESALKRDAQILAEIKGYGYYSDAYRATDPDPEAVGSSRTIKACLKMAGLNPEDIDYINGHGTSTKMNDKTETIAIKNVFGDYAYKVPVSSTKSMIGHSIMAAAALEGIVCIKSINENVIHPTRNWRTRDPELDLDYVPNEPREKKVKNALSNSFGFGGQNASVVFSKFEK